MSRCTIPLLWAASRASAISVAHLQQRLDFHRTPRDAVLECHPIQELHRDERFVFVFADFVDRANVGMVQRGGRSRLAAEAFQGREDHLRHREAEISRLQAV